MKDYTMSTKKSFYETRRDLAIEFERWEIDEWETNLPPGADWDGFRVQTDKQKTVTLKFKKKGIWITLTMSEQPRAVDNIRVLYKAINAMRLNELRGIDKVIQSAMKQLPGSTDDPYSLLGVERGYDAGYYEAKYRDLIRKWHPDKPGGSELMTSRLNQAITEIRRELS